MQTENGIILSDFQFALNPADARQPPFSAHCTVVASCSHHVQYYVFVTEINAADNRIQLRPHDLVGT